MRLHIKLVVFCLLALSVKGVAQTSDSVSGKGNWTWQKGGNWYVSWGYSKWWYPNTDIRFDMKSTDGSAKQTHDEFVVKDAQAHDAPWLDILFTAPLTVPQYCVRVGYFFNKSQTLGFELTYDHAKFIVNTEQDVRVVGTSNGIPFDSIAHLSPEGPNAFIFKLNNGANFFAFTLVRKFNLFNLANGRIRGSYLLKAGAGWNVPHVENTIFGASNKPYFQPIGGWNVGVEGALRVLFFNRVYWEFGQKGVYAAYYKLRTAGGTARVSFPTYGVIMSLGLNFPGKKHNEVSTNVE